MSRHDVRVEVVLRTLIGPLQEEPEAGEKDTISILRFEHQELIPTFCTLSRQIRDSSFSDCCRFGLSPN